MGWKELVRETWDIVPIFLLLLVGGVIAVRSGSTGNDEKQGVSRLMRNISHVALRLMGYMAVLLMIQYCIGLRPSLGW